MTPRSPQAARVHRSGRRLLLGVRVVLVLLFLVPVAVLALCGWTDWQHVGPDAISGTSTSTRCRYGDADAVIACYGDFVSDDGTLALHDVQIRLEDLEDGHTGPATASRTSHRWVVLGTSHARVWTLLLQQAMGVSLVWLLAYGGVIMGLVVVTVAWTGRQVGRAFGAATGGPTTRG
jgi:hypothetical protein